MTTTNPSATFEPKPWNAAANQGSPAPYIPVLRGLTFQAYAEALESWGVNRETGDHTAGNGYEESISVITDPATGIIGYVTQWEWNSRVEYGVWSADGFEKRGLSDVHIWPWDAVKTVRHLITHGAFAAAGKAGELQGYWLEAQDFETARAANEAWVAQRIASYR